MTTRYPISIEKRDQIDRTFTYHAPHGDQADRYALLRSKARELADEIIRLTPPSREQSLAFTKLEEVIFFANAAIARNEPKPAPHAGGVGGETRVTV